jgi:hypothetical protein
MATRAVIEARIDALEEALSRGIRRVQFEGVTTEYQTSQDMIRALDRLKAQLTAVDRPGLVRVPMTTKIGTIHEA